VGYPGTNRMSDFDDNGDFYFISLGTVTGGSGIFRIKAGASEIDKAWNLKIEDFKAGSCFAFCTVKGGKIYTRISTSTIAKDFSNLYSEMWDPYVIDAATRVATKITGMPTHQFWGYANQIAELDGKIYYGCTSAKSSINGYYEVNGNSAIQVFNVTTGGNVIGLWKLQQ
jgi:hypothetical protein